MLLFITRFALVIINHRGGIIYRWRRRSHFAYSVLLMLLVCRLLGWDWMDRSDAVVVFACLKLASIFCSLLFFAFILLDGSIEGLLDLLSSRCKVNVAQFGQPTLPTRTTRIAGDLSLLETGDRFTNSRLWTRGGGRIRHWLAGPRTAQRWR